MHITEMFRSKITRASWVGAAVLSCQVGCDRAPQEVQLNVYESVTWIVKDTASVVLGEQGGPDGSEFGFIQGAVILSDGYIAVADHQSNSIRLFTPAGDLFRSLGRSGSGPGEFGYLYSLALAGADTLVAFDLSTRRLSWFTRDGFVKSIQFEAARATHPQIYGPFRDGSLLQVEAAPLSASEYLREGALNDSSAYVVYKPDGSVIDTVGWFPTSDMLVGFDRSKRTRMKASPIFGRSIYTAVGANVIAVGKNDSAKIDVFSAQGELLRTVRWPLAERAVTPANVEEYEKAVTDPSLPARLAELMVQVRRSMPPARTFPSFSQPNFDSEGNLWIGDYALPGAAPAAFTVFDTAGTLITRVNVPEAERILYIGSTHMLMLRRDQDDVRMVMAHAIHKSQAP